MSSSINPFKEISFFTPLEFAKGPKTKSQSLLEKVDDFFYVGGKKARVLKEISCGVISKKGYEIKMVEARVSNKKWKIALYCTGIVPLVMLIAKAILRFNKEFHPQKKPDQVIDISSPILSASDEVTSSIGHPISEINENKIKAQQAPKLIEEGKDDGSHQISELEEEKVDVTNQAPKKKKIKKKKKVHFGNADIYHVQPKKKKKLKPKLS